MSDYLAPLDYQIMSIDKIKGYERNSRTHSKKQIAQVAESIKTYNFRFPISVDESNTIVAGHCRVLAAKELGMKEVPVIVQKNLTGKEFAALVIIENKLAANAGWDAINLYEEIESLGENGTTPEQLGFSADDVSRLADDYAQIKMKAMQDAMGDDANLPADEEEEKNIAKALGIHEYKVSVTKEMLDAIVEKVKICQELSGAETKGEALWILVNEWSESNVE